MIETGRWAQRSFTVTSGDTAAHVGSGDLEVLATPRLLAWCEATTCTVVAEELAGGDTTVGTRVSLEHLIASPVGARVEATATVTYVDGRLVVYGEVTRVAVNRERFLSRLR